MLPITGCKFYIDLISKLQMNNAINSTIGTCMYICTNIINKNIYEIVL